MKMDSVVVSIITLITGSTLIAQASVSSPPLPPETGNDI